MIAKRNIKLIKAIFLAAAVLFVVTAAAILITNLIVTGTTKARIFAVSEIKDMEYDAILVFGCGVYNNSTPSLLLQERLDIAIELYQNETSAKIIMSGDHGQKDYDEVNVMKQYAISRGVPSADIFMDHAGFSTYESLYRAKEIFSAEKLLLVTQEYHLYRALYIADALNLDGVGVSADQRRLSGQDMRDLREVLARTKDFVYCQLKPQPTYLGETISLDQNSDITNG